MHEVALPRALSGVSLCLTLSGLSGLSGLSALLAVSALLALLAVPLAGHAEEAGGPYIWVDAQGVTHVTDDPAAVPPAHKGHEGEIDHLRALWRDGVSGPPPTTPAGASGSDAHRVVRLLRGAVADLNRGETARATATLHSVLRLDPRRAEVHWYLAQLARERGRYGSSEQHLRAFLDDASPQLERWRTLAKRQLVELADERRLADETRDNELQLVSLSTDHFRIRIDRDLGDESSRYAAQVMGVLEEARGDVSAYLGVTPSEPLGVLFYGKAAYQRAHQHRFSFQTIGFFDGRIHVSSPAHPSPALRSLLFHEYTHAIFREQTGADQPYWLNEGLAEQVERVARKQPTSTRSERASLRTRIATGRWLPLRRLGPSFSGLDDQDARAAYLQSIAAAEWISERTVVEQRALLLRRLGEGYSIDQALHEVMGIDTERLDAAVQEAILAEFPNLPAEGAH